MMDPCAYDGGSLKDCAIAVGLVVLLFILPIAIIVEIERGNPQPHTLNLK